MIVELIFALMFATGILAIGSFIIWNFTQEDIFLFVSIILGLICIALLLFIVASIANWTGQVIQGIINQSIKIG